MENLFSRLKKIMGRDSLEDAVKDEYEHEKRLERIGTGITGCMIKFYSMSFSPDSENYCNDEKHLKLMEATAAFVLDYHKRKSNPFAIAAAEASVFMVYRTKQLLGEYNEKPLQ